MFQRPYTMEEVGELLRQSEGTVPMTANPPAAPGHAFARHVVVSNQQLRDREWQRSRTAAGQARRIAAPYADDPVLPRDVRPDVAAAKQRAANAHVTAFNSHADAVLFAYHALNHANAKEHLARLDDLANQGQLGMSASWFSTFDDDVKVMIRVSNLDCVRRVPSFGANILVYSQPNDLLHINTVYPSIAGVSSREWRDGEF